MIVLNSTKGWTGPKEVDRQPVEGNFRSHQVPLHPADQPGHLKLLEDWLRSYRPAELFDEHGGLRAELAALAPNGQRRMGANPHANGGLLLRDLHLPDYREYAALVPVPGAPGIGDTPVLGPSCAMWRGSTTPSAISASSGRTRLSPTAWPPCSRRRTANGTPPPRRATSDWRRRAG